MYYILNPNLEIYVIGVALTAIFLNFSNDLIPYIMRIPALILAGFTILAVLCSISMIKYLKIRTISLSKNCHETKFNTLIIDRDIEITGIEVIPQEIGTMTLREQNIFKSISILHLFYRFIFQL